MVKRILILICGVILCQGLFATPTLAGLYKKKKVTIGFIPGTSIDELKKNSVSLALLIQKKIGIPVDIYISKNYAGLVEAMEKKKVDFAFFSALTFVFAEKRAKAKVLLKKRWSNSFYYSSIVSLKGSGIKKISDLKGKRFAFVDKNSASGYLLPRLHLKKSGYNIDRFFSKSTFTGNHDLSIEKLIKKEVDAVAVFADDKDGVHGAWERNKKKIEVNKLWISDPIPTDPFCVRNDFYLSNPRLTHDLMFALIELDNSNEGRGTLRDLLNVTRLELATKGQYKPIRDLVKELGLKLEQ